jgi:hypothetical protein
MTIRGLFTSASIMGSGKMGYWSIGKIPLDREAIKNMSSLFKLTFQYSTIPLFHLDYMKHVPSKISLFQ